MSTRRRYSRSGTGLAEERDTSDSVLLCNRLLENDVGCWSAVAHHIFSEAVWGAGDGGLGIDAAF